MIPPVIALWLKAFLFTQLVEVPVYRRTLGVSTFQAFGASMITHPIVWFVLTLPAWGVPWLTRVVVAELFAWLMEATYFKWIVGSKGNVFAYTLLANALSCGLGLFCHYAFGFL